jgi:hypothetical protein
MTAVLDWVIIYCLAPEGRARREEDARHVAAPELAAVRRPQQRLDVVGPAANAAFSTQSAMLSMPFCARSLHSCMQGRRLMRVRGCSWPKMLAPVRGPRRSHRCGGLDAQHHAGQRRQLRQRLLRDRRLLWDCCLPRRLLRRSSSHAANCQIGRRSITCVACSVIVVAAHIAGGRLPVPALLLAALLDPRCTTVGQGGAMASRSGSGAVKALCLQDAIALKQ